MKSLKVYSTIFLVYLAITLLIFHHRVVTLQTHYGLADVDTDGTLWYYWAKSVSDAKGLSFDFNDYLSFPLGYDLSYIPFSSLIYDVHIWFAKLLGPSLTNLVLIANVSTLLTFPLSAIAMFALSMYITKNKFASFLSGIVFSFSYFHILMGRGSLSTNHFYFMPLYFLSLFYYLDKKGVPSLLLSSAVMSLTFWANAYWGFFCGLVSPLIVLLYKNEPGLTRLRTFLLYYVAVFAVLATTNINFIIQQAYNFNNQSKIVAGRIVDMESQLINLSDFVVPGNNSFLYRGLGGRGDFFLGYIALIVGFLGLVGKKRRPSTYYLVLALFILTICLQARTPMAGVLNTLYFSVFGFFRAVSRFSALSGMFLALMVAMSLNYILETKNGNKYKNVLLPILTVLILLEGLNKDSSWKKLTPITRMEDLYKPISNNPKIQSLAAYPMRLSNATDGLPPNHQLLAQVVHGKKMAGGASPFQEETLKYHKATTELLDPATIGTLEDHKVDAILIYPNKMEYHVTQTLKKDSRLTYAGYFEYLNSKSPNYDLFYINKNYFNEGESENGTAQNLYETKGGIDNNYVTISQQIKPFNLEYKYPYSKDFYLYPKMPRGWFPKFLYLVQKPLEPIKHYRNSNYNNEWTLNIQTDKPITLTAQYKPRLVEQLSNIIRSVAFGSIAIFILYSSVLKRYQSRRSR